MAGDSGSLVKLKLTRLDVKTDATCGAYTVMINPSELSRQRSIRSSRTRSAGGVAQSSQFAGYGDDTLTFSLTLDGTFATEQAPEEATHDVDDELAALSQVVYDYNGEKHEVMPVRITWGTLSFDGRLTSMSTQHTLFAPSGKTLRAKVTLSFQGVMSSSKASATADKKSADLTHQVRVADGDTLALLCQRIYGDPAYLVAVARHNGLGSLRRLQPGQVLQFPPLD